MIRSAVFKCSAESPFRFRGMMLLCVVSLGSICCFGGRPQGASQMTPLILRICGVIAIAIVTVSSADATCMQCICIQTNPDGSTSNVGSPFGVPSPATCAQKCSAIVVCFPPPCSPISPGNYQIGSQLPDSSCPATVLGGPRPGHGCRRGLGGQTVC
jgi:hypothetical protein